MATNKRKLTHFFPTTFLVLLLDLGSEIRDLGKSQDPGSGINIPDPQHCFQGYTTNTYHGSITGSVADPDPNPDPDPPDPHFWASWIRILLSVSKNSKNTLISTDLWLLFDFLSLKNYVKVPSRVICRKTVLKLVFCRHLEGQWWKWKDPDLLVRGMDPRIWIHTKLL